MNNSGPVNPNRDDDTTDAHSAVHSESSVCRIEHIGHLFLPCVRLSVYRTPSARPAHDHRPGDYHHYGKRGGDRHGQWKRISAGGARVGGDSFVRKPRLVALLLEVATV